MHFSTKKIMRYLFRSNPILYAFTIIAFLTHPSFASFFSQDVQVEELKGVSLENIGLLTPEQGGFAADIWKGSDHGYIETLFSFLPSDAISPVAQQLTTRLLLSAVNPPDKGNTRHSLLELRLQQLARMGNYSAIEKILERIPAKQRNETMAHSFIASLFVAGHIEEACKKTEGNLSTYHTTFLQKSLIVCQAWKKNIAQAELSMELLKEDGHAPSQAFSTLIPVLGKEGEESKQALTTWQEMVQADIISTPGTVPSQPRLAPVSDIALNSAITSWWKPLQAVPEAEKALHLSSLYMFLETSGYTIKEGDWQELVSYALYYQPSSFLPLTLAAGMRHTILKKRQGEALLYLLILLGNNAAVDLPPYVATTALTTLKNLGMEKEARQLLTEILKKKGTPPQKDNKGPMPASKEEKVEGTKKADKKTPAPEEKTKKKKNKSIKKYPIPQKRE